MKRYSQSYILAFHFGCDVREMSDMQYQPTRFSKPKVYTSEDYYYCVVDEGKKPAIDKQYPDRWKWEKIATYYEKDVYRALSY